MRARDDLRSRDHTLPALQQMNDKINRTSEKNMETVRGDRTDPSKLWKTIKAIDDKSQPKAENDAISFDDSQVSSPKQIANYFNR